ncbi:hypothetical protein PaeBR_08615 [Paenibacillus sp. BR2-3]
MKVELPAYEIAEIQAFVTRDFDSKRSTGSETLHVLQIFRSVSFQLLIG